MADSPLSLSALLGQVRGALKEKLPGTRRVTAEILELHVNRRGHCYLELIEKDPAGDAVVARARATIWASRFSMLRPFFETSTHMKLTAGIKVLVAASAEFHPQYGFSLNITDIDPSYTLGDLARKKQEVIRRLREEGVMEMNRGVPFPTVPQRIAVISSETAAGYGDFIDTLENNAPGFRFVVRLFPAVMQGDEAPASVMGALDRIHACPDAFDCVVITRGGGSRSDLECFNEYELAYYITQFPLPVVTGIGHERDESVADLVASRSLKTPTAAAEFLVEQLLAFEFRISAWHDQLSARVGRMVREERIRIERLGRDLDHYSRGSLSRQDEFLKRSRQSLRQGLSSWRRKTRDHLKLLETRTSLVRPENVLKRGYSITLLNGKALTRTEHLKKGMQVETRLYRGGFFSSVDQKKENHD